MKNFPKEPVISIKYIILFLAVFAGVFGAILAIFAYNKFASPDSLGVTVAQLKENPSAAEIKKLEAKISQIAFIPGDELPQVLIINDLTQMRANPFFKDASLKDYILIYKNAGKVIVYNPTSNRIVNEGPYSPQKDSENSAIPKQQGTPSPEPSTSPSPTASPEPSTSPSPSPTP